MWDLKVIGMLMVMHSGFTEYWCFLCLWDSLATDRRGIKLDTKNIIPARIMHCQDYTTCRSRNCLITSFAHKPWTDETVHQDNWKKKLQRLWLYCRKVSQNHTGKVEVGYLCRAANRRGTQRQGNINWTCLPGMFYIGSAKTSWATRRQWIIRIASRIFWNVTL